MYCKSCNKIIDDDSNYCKYCGNKITSGINYKYDDVKLRDIFNSVYTTLISYSKYNPKEDFDREFDSYKNYENRVMSDNEYYKMLVDIIFYSGFKASTVEKHLNIIHSYFSDYRKVASYSSNQIDEIKNDDNMIKNEKKINACVENAVEFEKIIKDYGSFYSYINSFSPNKNDDCLFDLKRGLEKNFSYVGETTSYHFMTDIGLNVLKPDRVILRIFYRLGLINDEHDLIGAVKAGRAFSNALNFPIRYIDIIFVSYGQLDIEKLECICSKNNPKCKICGANNYCNYFKTAG